MAKVTVFLKWFSQSDFFVLQLITQYVLVFFFHYVLIFYMAQSKGSYRGCPPGKVLIGQSWSEWISILISSYHFFFRAGPCQNVGCCCVLSFEVYLFLGFLSSGNNIGVGWYFFHFVNISLKIRTGYPVIVEERTLYQSPTIPGYVAFNIYYAIPFCYEMRRFLWFKFS